ncbi:hypothetical protein OXX80_006933 [Metschnikowia pulcherrima]
MKVMRSTGIRFLFILAAANLCVSISAHFSEFNISSHLTAEDINRGELSVFWCPLEQREAALAVEHSLNFLFVIITAYSKGMFLSMDEFVKIAESIGQELDGITACVKNTPLEDSFILKQLRFVTLTYTAHLEATGYLHYYDSNTTSQQLLRSIIKLNLYLLSLHDSSGAPSIVGHENTLSRSHAFLKVWGNLFQKLTNLPLGMKFLFESHYLRAQNTISYLAKSVSQPR